MTQEALKLALDLATMHHTDDGYAELRAKVRSASKEALKDHAMRETQRLGQEIEQEPVAWPCLIDSADFSENTITLVMQCEDYKVSAGTHWLSTVPPQRKPLTDDLYNELLFAVENKYTDETRHQTALRYIKQAEMPSARPAQAAHGIKENT